MPVTFHSYEDVSDLPENVQTLVELLKRPLRGTQRLASLPSMTPLALAQLYRIPDRGSDADTGAPDDTLDKISSVANLVLSTSRAIEESVRGARPTISHWYTLLRTIAQSRHPEAHVMADVPFIYPEGFDGESGECTMLVAFSADESLVHLNLVVEGPLESENAVPLCMEHHLGIATDQVSISESGVEEESVGDENEFSGNKTQDQDEDDEEMDVDMDEDKDEEDKDKDEEDEERSYRYRKIDHPMFSAAPRNLFSQDEAEEHFSPNSVDLVDLVDERFSPNLVDEDEASDEPWLDLPLEAHILAERRTWPSVLFPVLCAASEDDIVPLVASSAYQRWTWGIDLPIVGLEISNHGSIARVYIGWVDPSSDLGHMPTVRIIHPLFKTRSSPVAQGLFDLATPQSALELASFVLALGYQFDVLRHALPSKHLHSIKWRSDSDTVSWAESIHDWCISLDTSNQSSSTDSSDGLSPITPTSNLVFFDMSRKSKDNTLGRPDKAHSALSTTQAGAESIPAEQKLVSKGNERATSISRISCSLFAKETAKKDTSTTNPDPTMKSWMLHRFTFTLGRMFGRQAGNYDPPGYEQMMQSYEELSRPSWPKGWTALDKLPKVDTCLESRRTQLFETYSKMQQAGTKFVALDEHLAKITNSRLSLLLKSSAGAYTKEARSISTLEAESRHDFDALFCNFYVNDAHQVTSPDVLFERELRLPLNTLLEGLKGSEPDKCASKLHGDVDDWATHVRLFHDDLKKMKRGGNSNVTPVILRQAQQTSKAVDKISDDLNETSLMNSATTIEWQSLREPNRGTCDAIMVTLVPLPTEGKADTAYTNSRLVIANYDNSTGQVKKAKQLQELGELKESRQHEGEEDSTQSSGQEEEAQPSQSTEMYDHPLSIESGDYPPFEPEIDPSLLSARYILLPQISAEYKRPSDDDETKALNQARIYDITSAKYLGTLGIKNFPVFSLPVHGTRASLIMAWQADNDNIYLVERNVRKFDILDPIQVFHLATVILRIKAREEGLIALYNKHKEPYESKLKAGIYDKWAMPESKKTTVALPPPTTPLTRINETPE